MYKYLNKMGCGQHKISNSLAKAIETSSKPAKAGNLLTITNQDAYVINIKDSNNQIDGDASQYLKSNYNKSQEKKEWRVSRSSGLSKRNIEQQDSSKSKCLDVSPRHKSVFRRSATGDCGKGQTPNSPVSLVRKSQIPIRFMASDGKGDSFRELSLVPNKMRFKIEPNQQARREPNFESEIKVFRRNPRTKVQENSSQIKDNKLEAPIEESVTARDQQFQVKTSNLNVPNKRLNDLKLSPRLVKMCSEDPTTQSQAQLQSFNVQNPPVVGLKSISPNSSNLDDKIQIKKTQERPTDEVPKDLSNCIRQKLIDRQVIDNRARVNLAFHILPVHKKKSRKGFTINKNEGTSGSSSESLPKVNS